MTRLSSISATGSSAGTDRIRRALRALPCLFCLLCGAPARAGADVPLERLLERVGQQVNSFWNYFSSVTCTETLTQSKLGEKGKVLVEQRAAYNYLILLQNSGADIAVDESRVEKNHKGGKNKSSLLLTNGFAILTLVLHPIYQSHYEFKQLPDDQSGGRPLLRVAFRQISRQHALSALLLREREYPLEWSGTAWINPATFAVARIQTGLENPMEEFGLLRLDADVHYSEVQFSGSAAYWLPARAVIEAATKRQRWRNTHLFTEYRRFDVETNVQIGTPN